MTTFRTYMLLSFHFTDGQIEVKAVKEVAWSHKTNQWWSQNSVCWTPKCLLTTALPFFFPYWIYEKVSNLQMLVLTSKNRLLVMPLLVQGKRMGGARGLVS